MKLRTRQSNFSQFSDDIWLVAEYEGTRIDFDVDQSDLLSFAQNLIDIVGDCLRKSEKDTDKLQEMTSDLIEGIDAVND